MKTKLLIWICAMVLGFGAAAYTIKSEIKEPPRTVAWWSLMYERPNPERLPVKVSFWIAEGI